MPKYYRFRALSPTRHRKPKQQRDREGKEKGDREKPREVKELDKFRALTPTRKPKPRRDREGKEKGDREKQIEVKALEKVDTEPNFADTITLACSPAPPWYLRRIAWRQSPPLTGHPRQLSSAPRASFYLSRPIFIIKMPAASDFQRM